MQLSNSAECKALATIDDADAEFGQHGGFTAVLSTPSQDRDGDRLARKDWMPLPERLPLDADHGMSVAATIGSFEPYWSGDKLMMRAYFADTPKAQEVRALVRGRHVTGVSVAFRTDRDRKSAGQPYRELLNAGVVAIPSNPDAVIVDAKSAVNALFAEALTKTIAGDDASALLQAIHDAAGHLGAECVQQVVPDFDPTGEDDGANDAAKAVALRLRVKALAV